MSPRRYHQVESALEYTGLSRTQGEWWKLEAWEKGIIGYLLRLVFLRRSRNRIGTSSSMLGSRRKGSMALSLIRPRWVEISNALSYKR